MTKARRILVEAHHPAHIHFFKHAFREWQQSGHRPLMLARDRDVMRALLDAYDWIDARILTTGGRRNRFPLFEFGMRQLGVAGHIALRRPHVVASLMGSYTQSSRILRVPSVIFTDSEHQAFNHRIAHPFARRIFTPDCFDKELGRKQTRYAGYHELAFLHPSRFAPDAGVLDELGGVEAHSYCLVRTSAFNTLHDIGQAGLGPVIDDVIETLRAEGPVFLVAEGNALPEKYRDLRFDLAPHRFHDAIAFSRLVVSEGASTASEAACLGVPSVYVNSHALGYLRDQERRYDLVDVLQPGGPILDRVRARLSQTPDRARWDAARDELVSDHIDVTAFVVEQVLSAARR